MNKAITSIGNVKEQVTEAEWLVRQDLAAAARLVACYGCDDMAFTHLSARVPGADDHFLLNPFGYLFNEVTASNLVKVDLDGNIVLDNGHRVKTVNMVRDTFSNPAVWAGLATSSWP